MDHAYYSQLWLDLRVELYKLIEEDEVIRTGKPIENRDDAETLILNLYFRYRHLVKRLTFCFDQIVQPQIREFIRKELDFAIIRMLEVRQEMASYSCSDYPWPIEPLMFLKLTPDDVELTCPAYDAAARQAEFDRRKTLFENFLDRTRSVDGSDAGDSSFESGETEESQSSSKGEEEKEKSEMASAVAVVKQRPEIDLQEAERKAFNDAILLIQAHERARVGRNIAKNVVRELQAIQRLGSQQLSPKKVNLEERVRAAIIIQKTWRGFSVRRKIEERNRKVEELLYMTIKSGGTRKILETMKECFEFKSNMQAMALKKLEDMIKIEEKRLREHRGPSLIEDIRAEIRAWFFEWFEKMGFFDYIPPAECGGSVLIATGQSRTPEEYATSLSQAKEKKKDKPKPPEDEEEKVDESPKEDEGWKMKESRVVQLLTELNKEFTNKWSNFKKQILDPHGALINDFIYEDICYKLQLEMREIADESMRQELENLNAALLLDHKGEDFSLPKPQECEAIVPEEKPGTELIPNSSVDDLVIELMRNKVIQECPECYMSDWPGVPSYVYTRSGEIRLGDIKQAVMDYCVLPIASKVVHELSPFVRSVCLCGPPGAGQIFIARAICTELKATVFNLTPENLRRRYKSKGSQERLVLAIIKVARAFGPAVVLVEGNSAWLKQVPPQLRRVDPKRFSPIYKKIVSLIEPGDQVLFLTAATHPYLADKSFVKLHDKFIIIPVADYGTTYVAYKKSLMSQHAIPRHFKVSALARLVAKDTPLEFARNALDECLRIGRRMDFARRPLHPAEVLDTLLSDPDKPTKKELELFAKFRSNLPSEKRRLELVEAIRQAEADEQKK